MIKASLINWPTKNPLESISHAAKVCYQDTAPEWGKTIDIENNLWETGHHTTFQHFYCTFLIEDIAIGDVTFGLHLASPFYNTSQRSGRFCGKMFNNPDFEMIEGYIKQYWPEVKNRELVLNYIQKAITVYQSNIDRAVEEVKRLIKEERPNASASYIEKNAPKIAQEQLRMFIPVVFPTALEYTINISALAGMYCSAWSPGMIDVTQKMVDIVLKKWPEIDFAFQRKEGTDSVSAVNWCDNFNGIAKKPKTKLISKKGVEDFALPKSEEMHSVDLAHFSPHLMDNNVLDVETEIEISVATMGQDQRHRTVRRGKPSFNGKFYFPPVLDDLGLEKEAEDVFSSWLSFRNKFPESLMLVLAPYGAMVRYHKKGSYNAVVHELSKRLCWCAQEEIYEVARSLQEQLQDHPLAKAMAPNCVLTGKCGEGGRYCGRDMKIIEKNPFPERKI
ncbi:MAG: FAD-dependent thymidylate synthase [Patescibacteria group bacterium]|nr:FAD-dependent thymidylate synthase [Patescibacteria group bacterium]